MVYRSCGIDKVWSDLDRWAEGDDGVILEIPRISSRLSALWRDEDQEPSL